MGDRGGVVDGFGLRCQKDLFDTLTKVNIARDLPRARIGCETQQNTLGKVSISYTGTRSPHLVKCWQFLHRGQLPTPW